MKNPVVVSSGIILIEDVTSLDTSLPSHVVIGALAEGGIKCFGI